MIDSSVNCIWHVYQAVCSLTEDDASKPLERCKIMYLANYVAAMPELAEKGRYFEDVVEEYWIP